MPKSRNDQPVKLTTSRYWSYIYSVYLLLLQLKALIDYLSFIPIVSILIVARCSAMVLLLNYTGIKLHIVETRPEQGVVI